MADIAIVGEAWGEKEAEEGRPFVGTSGWLLDNMLAQVGIARRECLVTNVFNLRPPRNDVKFFCGPKPEGIPGLPALTAGKWVNKKYAPELERLYNEIAAANPNVVVALGATAAWALLHSSGIKGVRGSLAQTASVLTPKLGREYKVLPTYHPAAVARQWDLRPIVLADLDKAKRHSHEPTYQRPRRSIWIKPTIADIAQYDQDFIAPAVRLAADIETRQDQITCIGFAPDAGSALVIPFFDQAGRNYWSFDEEILVWNRVRGWLASKPTIFQNGLYDINFLWSRYGIPVPLASEDTMLMQHAHQPEMEKGLAFLASVYTDEASWKFMAKGKKHD